jgi:hypothetical protein
MEQEQQAALAANPNVHLPTSSDQGPSLPMTAKKVREGRLLGQNCKAFKLAVLAGLNLHVCTGGSRLVDKFKKLREAEPSFEKDN